MTVSKSIVREIYSDSLKTEIADYLNSVIDEELLKDDVNTDLIDECIEALDALENGDMTALSKSQITEKAVLKYCKKHAKSKSTAGKRAVAAVLIATLCSSAVLLSTDTALAKEIKSFFSEIIEALNITAGRSEEQDAEIASIYAVFPSDYSFKIRAKSNLDLDNITVYAVYKDGSEKEIPLSDCTVDTVENFGGDPNTTLLVIAYDGCAFSIKYTISEPA